MVKRLNLMLSLITVLGLCLALSECRGTNVVYTERGDQEVTPTYREKGPPPWAPAYGYRAKHRYHYYPSSHVYYDIDRGIYFYYKDGGWQVSVSLPYRINVGLGDHVSLEMDTDKPYEFHPDVVKRYPPGQLKKKHKKKGRDKW